MTIEIPGAVQWLVPIVVGADWPEGDEDALRRLGQAWEQVARVIGEAAGDGNAAAQAALGAMDGEAAKAFAEYWDRFVAGDEQFLVTLQQACEELGQGCDEAALNVEYTKLSIIAALLILAAQIAALGGITDRHQGLHETWHDPQGSDYTAGPNERGWRFTTQDGAEVRANVDSPYTGPWNSSQAQHIPPDGGPNNINVDDDYLLPTSLEPSRDT